VASEDGPGIVKDWGGSMAGIAQSDVGLIGWRAEGWRTVNMKWMGRKERCDGPAVSYIEECNERGQAKRAERGELA
jgi:hypothetical protein